MSILSRLFGRAPTPEADPELYDGFHIFAEPYSDDGGYRICARIEKTVGGEDKTHRMVRADTCADLETAKTLSLSKAKQLIDQMGDGLFG